MLAGVMPPTGSSQTSSGSTARQALTTARRQRLGREQLERIGAGRERGEGLGRRRDARARRAGLRALAARMTAGSPCGITISRPPAAATCGDLRRRQHGAGADQRALAERRGELLDAGERLGRVERHLDRDEARREQRLADRDDLVRPHAAQDRDQRQGARASLQLVHSTSRPRGRSAAGRARWRPAAAVRAPRPAASIALPIALGELRTADHRDLAAPARPAGRPGPRRSRCRSAARRDRRRCRSPAAGRTGRACAR